MVPTLSEIQAYTTDHLIDAADHWDGLADRWEDAHWQVRNQAHVLDWQGAAADALRARTRSDYTVAGGQADQRYQPLPANRRRQPRAELGPWGDRDRHRDLHLLPSGSFQRRSIGSQIGIR